MHERLRVDCCTWTHCALCRVGDQVTNDIFTREDGEFLVRHDALPEARIRAIETGGCPHAAIREDISANLQACEDLTDEFDPQMLLVESGGGRFCEFGGFAVLGC